MSGRINTRGKKNIKYGKVEVKAKLPQGDWLWPAIWMLPESNSTANGTQAEGTGVYGPWPVSGEIDVSGVPYPTCSEANTAPSSWRPGGTRRVTLPRDPTMLGRA